MTFEGLLQVLTQFIFYFLAVITFLRWWRYPSRVHLDTMHVFVSIGLAIFIQDLQVLFPVIAPFSSIFIAIAFVVHPFFLLRLVRHFYPIPTWVHRLTLIALIFILISLAFLPISPVLPLILAIGYIVLIEGYASYIIVYGAFTIKGFLGYRLRLASIGSGLLTLFFLTAFMLVFIFLAHPNAQFPPWLGVFGQSLSILSGLSYYLGFASPRWLKQNWQYKEFYNFVNQTTHQSYNDNYQELLEKLATGAFKAVGGQTAAITHWDASKESLTIKVQSTPPFPIENFQPLREKITNIQKNKQGYLAHIPQDVMPETAQWANQFGAKAMYIIPIVGALQTWGYLLIPLRHEPLFTQDDLDLLTLLVAEIATALDKDSLIQELQQRQIELEVTNKELESFSYSVSHDLRAPLRAINGFSQALSNKYADALDEQGKHYLNRIRENTHQMGELIDDLLALSRITRREMEIDNVYITKIAREIDERLRSEEPDRQVQFEVEEFVEGLGDADLISNAWKFTSSRATALIQVGVLPMQSNLGDTGKESKIFFVRDNGVGFDMKYADKLFGAFQRLHSTSEFPGTGIGLAIVQRIIHRHGGKIWAESELEKGATFYFTLGEIYEK
jgi:signal transduction histidine kinase